MGKDKIKQYGLASEHKYGIEIFRMEDRDVGEGHDIFTPHRDTHYLLLVLTSGNYKMMVDFEEINASLPCLLLVTPGQLHQVLEVASPVGYAVSFEPSVISSQLHDELRANPDWHFLIKGPGEFLDRAVTICRLVYSLHPAMKDAYILQSVIELLQALLSLIAGAIAASYKNKPVKDGRSKSIEKKFRLLLHDQYKNWKKPSLYAEALALSHYHLNNTVKSLTGSPLTAHIQNLSVLEAKRLLFLTDLSVKEISYEVGYDDPVYFSRLFKKITQITPAVFRQQFHD